MAQSLPAARLRDPVRRTRRVEFALATMIDEVRAGLSRRPLPELPCKYFYDERGSALFEAITELPEYYQTRTETALLAAHAGAIVEAVKPRELAELGSGAGHKIRLFLDAMRGRGRLESVTLLEINEPYLRDSVARLQSDYPEAYVSGVGGRLRPRPPGARSGRRPAAAVPRGHDREPAPRRPAGVLPRGRVDPRARRRLPRGRRPRQGPGAAPRGLQRRGRRDGRVQPQHPPGPERTARRRLRPRRLRAPCLLRPAASVDRDAPARAPSPSRPGCPPPASSSRSPRARRSAPSCPASTRASRSPRGSLAAASRSRRWITDPERLFASALLRRVR